MDRAAQAGFPFDVDNAGLTHCHTSRDSRWPTEAVLSDLQDCQPINLSDLATVNIDQNRPLGDEVAEFFLDAISTKDPLVERFLDLPGRDQMPVILARPIRRFPDEIGDFCGRGRYLLPIPGLPRAKCDQSFDRRAIEVR